MFRCESLHTASPATRNEYDAPWIEIKRPNSLQDEVKARPMRVGHAVHRAYSIHRFRKRPETKSL